MIARFTKPKEIAMMLVTIALMMGASFVAMRFVSFGWAYLIAFVVTMVLNLAIRLLVDYLEVEK